MRKCLSDIVYIRHLRLEKRMAARRAAQSAQGGAVKPPTIRRGALMVLLQQSANTLPLFIGKLGEAPPALCGAIPEDAGHVCQPGDAVAVLVKGDEDEENWILAEIVSHNVRFSLYIALGPNEITCFRRRQASTKWRTLMRSKSCATNCRKGK